MFAGCSFKADYGTGPFTCTDGKCPSGMECDKNQICNPPRDDAGMRDAPRPDGRQTAMTCADPQPFPAAGGSEMGTTAGQPAKVSSMCGGLVFNGPESVYAIQTAAGAHLIVAITGQRKAYLLAACQTLPMTPTCEGNNFASAAGGPISVFPNPGTQYLVVDDEVANASGTYTLTVTVQ